MRNEFSGTLTSATGRYGLKIQRRTFIAELETGRHTISSKQDKIRVLVADDQPHVLEAVELLLKPQGIDIDCARSPRLFL
jgi:PleD family two-component response regulator